MVSELTCPRVPGKGLLPVTAVEIPPDVESFDTYCPHCNQTPLRLPRVSQCATVRSYGESPSVARAAASGTRNTPFVSTPLPEGVVREDGGNRTSMGATASPRGPGTSRMLPPVSESGVSRHSPATERLADVQVRLRPLASRGSALLLTAACVSPAKHVEL